MWGPPSGSRWLASFLRSSFRCVPVDAREIFPVLFSLGVVDGEGNLDEVVDSHSRKVVGRGRAVYHTPRTQAGAARTL